MTSGKMILAAKKAMEKYRETFEVLAGEDAMTDEEFNDRARAIGIDLYEQMIRRDIPAVAETMKGVITGDVYRGEDGCWKTKGEGPDSREMNRLLLLIEKSLDGLEEWWAAEKDKRR